MSWRDYATLIEQQNTDPAAWANASQANPNNTPAALKWAIRERVIDTSDETLLEDLVQIILGFAASVKQQREALEAVKRGVDEFADCPFCNGYAGFEVDDPVLDEQGDIIGHDDGCPWPLVKLALGETQVYKHEDDEG